MNNFKFKSSDQKLNCRRRVSLYNHWAWVFLECTRHLEFSEQSSWNFSLVVRMLNRFVFSIVKLLEFITYLIFENAIIVHLPQRSQRYMSDDVPNPDQKRIRSPTNLDLSRFSKCIPYSYHKALGNLEILWNRLVM